jgi:hypothetical protein
MPVMTDAPDPDEEPEDDEFLADDDTPVENITADEKTQERPGRLNKRESEKLSLQIWEEYAGGMKLKQIGDLHGLTAQAVGKRIATLKAKQGLPDVLDAKALDLGRLESLIDRWWDKDLTPENTRTVVMLMNQKAKLLGLNAPKRLTVDGEMSITPSPALSGMLERIQAERLGKTEVKEIEGEIVEAELVEDD